MTCNCIKRINAELEPKGVKIAREFSVADNLDMNLTPPFVETEPTDKARDSGRRKPKAPKVLCTFCPFCGVKYAP